MMTEGDIVKASWTDGLVLTGKFSRIERGYIILIDNKGEIIACDPRAVKFEVIK